MEYSIPTGCASLDDVLGGGFRFGNVSLIYGEPSTGKTTLAVSCVAKRLRNDRWSKAYYLDSDEKLSTKRLTKVVDGNKEVLKRLLVWKPRDFREQTDIIERLIEIPMDNDVIVIDSITGPYRLEVGRSYKTFVLNKELNRQLGFLSEMAKTRNSAVLVVGQVHGVIGGETSQVEPVAKRLLRYWSDSILKLETTSVTGVRQAVLEKPRNDVKICRFRLGEAGIQEVRRFS